jgi:hypothetical protein
MVLGCLVQLFLLVKTSSAYVDGRLNMPMQHDLTTSKGPQLMCSTWLALPLFLRERVRASLYPMMSCSATIYTAAASGLTQLIEASHESC